MSDWEFCDMLRTAVREERERIIDEMSEEDAKDQFKKLLRAMFRIKDERDAGIEDQPWWPKK